MQDCVGGVCEKLEGTFLQKNCLQCGNIVTYHHHHHNFHKKNPAFSMILETRGMEEGVVKRILFSDKNIILVVYPTHLLQPLYFPAHQDRKVSSDG